MVLILPWWKVEFRFKQGLYILFYFRMLAILIDQPFTFVMHWKRHWIYWDSTSLWIHFSCVTILSFFLEREGDNNAYYTFKFFSQFLLFFISRGIIHNFLGQFEVLRLRLKRYIMWFIVLCDILDYYYLMILMNTYPLWKVLTIVFAKKKTDELISIK